VQRCVYDLISVAVGVVGQDNGNPQNTSLEVDI
jgi:hypothetical protein